MNPAINLQISISSSSSGRAPTVSADVTARVTALVAEYLAQHLQTSTAISSLMVDAVNAVSEETISLRLRVHQNHFQRIQQYIKSGQLLKLTEGFIERNNVLPDRCTVKVQVFTEPDDISDTVPVFTGMVEVTFHVFSTAARVTILSNSKELDKHRMMPLKLTENIHTARVFLPKNANICYKYEENPSPLDKFGTEDSDFEWIPESFERQLGNSCRSTVRDVQGFQNYCEFPYQAVVAHCFHIIQNSNNQNLYEQTEQVFRFCQTKGVSLQKQKPHILRLVVEKMHTNTCTQAENYLCFLAFLSSFGYFGELKPVMQSNHAQQLLFSCRDRPKECLYKLCHSNLLPSLVHVTHAAYGEKACVLMLMKYAYPFLDEYNLVLLEKQRKRLKVFVDMEQETSCISEIIGRICNRILSHLDKNDYGMYVLQSILKALPLKIIQQCTKVSIYSLKSPTLEARKLRHKAHDIIVDKCAEGISKSATFTEMKIMIFDHVPLFMEDLCEHVYDRIKSVCSSLNMKSQKVSNDDCRSLELLIIDTLKFNEDFQRDILKMIATSKIDFSYLLPNLLQRDPFTLDHKLCRSMMEKWLSSQIKKAQRKPSEAENVYNCLLEALSVPSVKESDRCSTRLKEEVLKFVETMKTIPLLEEATQNQWIKLEAQNIFMAHVKDILQRSKRRFLDYGSGQLSCVFKGNPVTIETKEKADLIVLLMDFICPIGKHLSKSATISRIMQNDDFWISMLYAKGKCVNLVTTRSFTYQKVNDSLKDLPDILHNNQFNSSFINYLHLRCYDSAAMKLLCVHIEENYLKSLIEAAFKRIKDAEQVFTELMLSLGMVVKMCPDYLENFVESDLKPVTRYCEENILNLNEGDEMDVDVILMSPILEIATNLKSSLVRVKSLLASSVFWRISKVPLIQHMQETEQETMGRTKIINFKDKIQRVDSFFKLLATDCVQCYHNIWEHFTMRTTITVSKVQEIFYGTNIDDEIAIFNEFSSTQLSKPYAEVLLSFCNHHKYKDTVDAMKGTLQAFCIDQDNNSKINQALTVYQTIESEIVGEKSLWDLSKDLEEVYKVASSIDPEMLSILRVLGNSDILIKFLKTVAEEDLGNLIDAVEDYSETLMYVQESTLYSLIQVKRFMKPLLTIPAGGPPEVFFETILKQQTESRVKHIDRKLIECNANVHGLIKLHKSRANRGQQTIEMVEAIIQSGKFSFFLEKDICYFEVVITQNTEEIPGPEIVRVLNDEERIISNENGPHVVNEKEVRYRKQELSDLRSRSHLIINAKQKNKDILLEEGGVYTVSGKQSNLISFISQVDKAMNIAETFSELQSLGYLEDNSFPYTAEHDEIDALLSLKIKELNHWNALLMKARRDHYCMNFVHPDHIPALHRYLKSDGKKERSDVLSILKYISPEAFLYDEHNENPIISTENILNRIAEMIGKALSDETNLLLSKMLPLKKNFMNFDRMTRVHPGTLCIAKLAEKSIILGIQTMLSLYYVNGGELPQANQVIICSPETQWNELNLLLQRCARAKEHYSKERLFCIVNADILPMDIQTLLSKEIQNLADNASYMLAVVFRGIDNQAFLHQFHNHIFYVEPFTEADTKDCFQKAWPDIVVVTSAYAGLGKTEFIKNAVFSQKQQGYRPKLATLGISGNVKTENLIMRLKKMNVTEDTVLHLDIGMVDKPKRLDTFLFQLLVLKYVSHRRMTFYLQTSKVYIEVANTANNMLLDSLQVVGYFKIKRLVWNNYLDFNISNELSSPEQVVCRYLLSLHNNSVDNAELSLCGQNILPLSEKDCKDMLRKYFAFDEDLSFTVVETFLRVLSKQLQKLSVSDFFRQRSIREMLATRDMDKMENPTARSSMVEILLEVSREFARRSIAVYKSAQETSHRYMKQLKDDMNLNNEDRTRTQIALKSVSNTSGDEESYNGMVKWEDTNHVIVVFHKDNNSLSMLYKELKYVSSSVKCIKAFIETQSQEPEMSLDLKSQDELRSMLLNIVSSTGIEPIDKDKKLQSYVLTPDNFLKFVLISLRIQAHIPVILMGETGCGKTSLIRILAILSDARFEVLSIHAGTTEAFIKSTVNECNSKALMNVRDDFWLFFDEINTSEQLGFITDIICHHQCQGKLLAQNLVLMAACNPYRHRNKNYVLTEGLKGSEADHLSYLVYRVHPLPESLIDYVWDFGILDAKDEEKYIKRMLQTCISTFNSPDRTNDFIELVVASQRFVRENEETEYCVSLRDVERCKELATWFLEFYLKKKENFSNFSEGHVIKAIILSLSICYFIRFRSTDIRKKYLSSVEDILKGTRYKYVSQTIFDIIQNEQRDILNNMDIPPGTAKNASLQENVFVMLVCTLNRLPLFVVGKPGCSKSFALQLLRNNMRGLDSKGEFFKKLPRLYYISYQGSEQSTSEGIEKVFKKALAYQRANENDDLRSVHLESKKIRGNKFEEKKSKTTEENITALLVLDEVGLAEKSQAHPLKVLHNLLESAGGVRSEVAFIGISNWALDAAKMNRAIHLSRPDMDFEELYQTGRSIHESMGAGRWQREPWYLKKLAYAYNEYKEKQEKKHFHGLRDYYALIKFISKSTLPDMSSEEQQDLIRKGILRNFSGVRKEFSTITEIFQRHLQCDLRKDSDITETIKENIKDRSCRHLLLISNADSIIGTVERMLDELGHEHTTMIGSNFPLDKNEDYGYRMLSNIILSMEQGQTLILKDLDHIYGSLYDMLNQNYTIVGEKKHCRIALGPHSNPMCHVHDAFKCIVIIDEDKMPYADPPFLNRFEKQIVSFEDMLSNRQIKTLQTLCEDIKSMCVTDDADSYPNILSPVLSKEKLTCVLASLVLKIDAFNVAQSNKFRKSCLEVLLPVLNPEAVLNLPFSQFWKENCALAEHLKQLYLEMPLHTGLRFFLNHREKSVSSSSVNAKMFAIFTYSNPLVHVSDFVETEDVHIETLSTISSEKDLEARMKTFWMKSKAKFLIVRSTSHDDVPKILLTNLCIQTWRKKYLRNIDENIAKHVAFIVHLDRDKGSLISSGIDFTSEWEFATLDTLIKPVTALPELLDKRIPDIINQRQENIESIIKTILHWAFHRINYIGDSHVDRIVNIVRKVSNQPKIVSLFTDIILEHLDSTKDNTENNDLWLIQIAQNQDVLTTFRTLTAAAENVLLERVKQPLAMLIYKIELMQGFQTLPNMSDAAKLEKWLQILRKPEFHSIKGIQTPSGPGCYSIEASWIHFKIPFSKVFLDRVGSLKESFLETCLAHQVEEVQADSKMEFSRTRSKIVFKQITELIEIHYDGLKEDYFDDFCNYIFASSLTKLNNRMEIIKWFIQYFDDSEEEFMSGSLHEFVTRLHFCFFKNSAVFNSALKLIERAPDVGIDVELVLEEIETGIQKENNKGLTKLIRTFCRAVIPNKRFLEKVDDNLTVWYQKANFVLCISDRIGHDENALDGLKFFIELVGMFNPHRMSKVYLKSMGDYLTDNDHEIIDKEIYELLMSFFKEFSNCSIAAEKRETSLLINKAITMYMNRCWSARPEFKGRISDLLKDLQKSECLFHMQLHHFGPMLKFYLKEEITENSDLFKDVLLSKSDEMLCGIQEKFRPFLKELDKAIRQAKCGISLSLLVVDILENEVFTGIETQINELYQQDNELIKMAVNAMKAKEDISLIQVIKIAYMKRFLFAFAKCMRYSPDGDLNLFENKTVIDLCNALLSGEESTAVRISKSDWRLYFLKCLENGDGMCNLMRVCESNSHIDVCNIFIHENTEMEYLFELDSRHLVDEETYATISETLAHSTSIEQDFRFSDKDYLACLLCYLTSNIFLKRYFRKVNVKENVKHAVNLIETTQSDLVDSVYKKLIRLFSLKEDADINLLRQTHLELQNIHIISSLSHFICVIYLRAPKTGFWYHCLTNPASIRDMLCSSQVTSTTNAKTNYSCSCHHRISTTKDECPVCRKMLSSETVACDFLQYQSDISFFTKREECSPFSFNLRQFLVYGCLVFSKALKLASDDCLKDILECNSKQIENLLVMKIEKHWENLCKLFNVRDGAMTYIVKVMIKTIEDDLVSYVPQHSELKKWEFKLNDFFQENEHQVTREVTIHNDSIGLKSKSYLYQLTRHITDDEAVDISTLLSISSLPSIENAYAELYVSKENHPFLKLVLEMHDELKLPKYIPHLIKWHKFMVRTCSYQIRKVDCESTISHLRDQLSKTMRNEFNKEFEEFLDIWEQMQQQLHSYSIPNIENLSPDSKMCECLLTRHDSTMWKVVEFLVEIQNTFLDKVLNICSHSHCLPLTFFKTDDNFAAIPIVSLADATSENVINIFETDDDGSEFNILEDILNTFSERWTSVEKCRSVRYNFCKIEFEMAQSILLGKQYISLQKHIPKMQFLDDVFQNTVMLISEVKSVVAQDFCLPGNVSRKIKDTKKLLPLDDMLTVSGSVLAHLKHTGGDPDTSYLKYVQTWKNILFHSIETDIFQGIGEELCLRHALPIYRIMEEFKGERELKQLSKDYRQPLSDPVKNQIKSSAETYLKVLKDMLTALKTFIYRNLSGVKLIETEEELITYLKHAPFWPEHCQDDKGNLIVCSDKDITLSDILPSHLKIRHVCSLAIHLTNVTELRKETTRPQQKRKQRS